MSAIALFFFARHPLSVRSAEIRTIVGCEHVCYKHATNSVTKICSVIKIANSQKRLCLRRPQPMILPRLNQNSTNYLCKLYPLHFSVRHPVISHARTVVRECCKGDDESQWERGKFEPPPPKNPLTDYHQNLCR